jgi:carbamoyl-phosphate synthase large subunit
MPRRTDISTILVVGSGPIVIGQAGEFDYSGTQACQALRDEGYRVVLVNSNPATIMTDPGVADRTYVEPLDLEALEAVIVREAPDALLPTLGGQTALNLAIELHESGALERHGVQLIGADVEAIRRAEDRDAFRDTMRRAGLDVPRSVIVESVQEGEQAAAELGMPLILRPAFTLGGHGGGIARDVEDLRSRLARGLDASPIGQVLVEESVLGWGEFELEVIRDRNDNGVIVCSIENLDPMGVHTGDSVTVAPAMTLSDTELQDLRDAALAVIRAIGVETGGSNVQFALQRDTGRIVVIEMNPRVSRSSALASKATGYPIARIAAQLAVGYTLDELPNAITEVTPASFEPALDYVAVKVPRFAFEKIPGADPELSTHMKSVGEVLALGRSFEEAFGKALAGRELDVDPRRPDTVAQALDWLRAPSWDRFDIMLDAARMGARATDLATASGVDPWFCRAISEMAAAQEAVPSRLEDMEARDFTDAAHAGVSVQRIAAATSRTDAEVWARRRAVGVSPTFHAVDSCAAEFAARTPYYYAAFDTESELRRDGRESVIVLGSGPNRIGQGVEFDYCCVHGVQTAQELGYAAVMVNCNPETVSTDHGISDRLYLEPVTLDSVLDICAAEQPRGVITQLGGQTPLRLASHLAEAGVPLLGTLPEAIDLAEDRARFGALLSTLGLRAPAWAVADGPDHAPEVAESVGYPVLVRPSYVLGGRAMRVCHSADELRHYFIAEPVSGPIFLDHFLEGATEFDVDALSDGTWCWVAGTMQHVEAAGVHSGDSACVLPAVGAAPDLLEELERQTAALASGLGAVGLLNVQYAVRGGEVYVIEANPRASRTVPFVSKATGVPVVRHAVRIMLGASVPELELPAPAQIRHVAVKEAVLPFDRFPESDPVLGPEMRATGEAMGVGGSFAEAFAKAQRGAGQRLPREGTLFISARDADKAAVVSLAGRFSAAGFALMATEGTAAALRGAGLSVDTLQRLDGSPNAIEMLAEGRIDLIVNTPGGAGASSDGAAIRRAAIRSRVPCTTTLEAAESALLAIESARLAPREPLALQDLDQRPAGPRILRAR